MLLSQQILMNYLICMYIRTYVVYLCTVNIHLCVVHLPDNSRRSTIHSIMRACGKSVK